MTSIKLNGKKYLIPSSWKEVTTIQYIRIITEWASSAEDIADRDFFILINIFTGLNFKRFERTIDNEITLTSALEWVITEPFRFQDTLPKVLKIGNKSVSIPEDPRELSIGQNIHLRRDFIEKSKYLEENISIATAIYLQPIIDNSLFKINRAKEISKQLEDMPAYLIYPIGFFLLRRALGFGGKPAKFWPLLKISLSTMFGRMLHGWRKFIS